MRLKPNDRSSASWPRVVTTGSTSTATSASWAMEKRRVMLCQSEVSCFSSRKVGVPPPKWTWASVRRSPSGCATLSISRASMAMYMSAVCWLRAITTLQPQYVHISLQNGMCTYSESGACGPCAPASCSASARSAGPISSDHSGAVG